MPDGAMAGGMPDGRQGKVSHTVLLVQGARPGLALLLALLCLAAFAGHALAQTPIPFGVGRPDAPIAAPSNAFVVWVMTEQSRFYKLLSAAIRAWKENGTAAWMLMGLSLAYGVFHAAGPGHGKAVISAYLFASGETLKKGIMLSFAAALVQALSAIVLVTILAMVLGATAQAMDDVALTLERASYALMVGVGLWLLWRKGRGLWALLGQRLGWAGPDLAHVHDAECGHVHAPIPDARQPWSLRSAAGTVFAIGVRPCTGAIIVLVFALAQGVFIAGIASTFAMALGTAVTVSLIATLAVTAKGAAVRLAAPGSFGAALALRSLEVFAALAVLAFGLTLLTGLVALPGG